jgi:hypothetical protein
MEKACSGCLIPLFSSLLRLSEQNARRNVPLRIYLGTDPKIQKDKAYVLIGDCAQVEGEDKDNWVGGCPPNREEILSRLTRFIA